MLCQSWCQFIFQFSFIYQAWKFGGNNCFITASFLSLIKDGNDNLFPQIHLHNTNVFYILIFQRCTNKHVFHNSSAITDLSRMLSYAVHYKKKTATVRFVVSCQQSSSQDLCVNIAHIRSKTLHCIRKYVKFLKVSFQVLIK